VEDTTVGMIPSVGSLSERVFVAVVVELVGPHVT
jgi:hypothetical protein